MTSEPGQLDRLDVAEPAMRFERARERIDETILGQRVEAVLPPDRHDPERIRPPIDPWLDPANEPVAEPDRQHVVAPSTLRGRDVHLPDVVEPEQRAQHLAVPDERIERRDEGDTGSPAVGWSTGHDLPIGLVEEWQLGAHDEPV